MSEHIEFVVMDRKGREHRLPADPGKESVMQVLYEAGMDVEAVCGGCCSCATCHVYLHTEDMGSFPERDENERMLLEYSEHYDAARSRLSCQLKFGLAHSGLRVEIAPED